MTKLHYFLGLPLVLLFVNPHCRLWLSTGATVVCLKGTVLVLKGVSFGVASAKTLRLLQCAFPCDDDTVFCMGEGDRRRA